MKKNQTLGLVPEMSNVYVSQSAQQRDLRNTYFPTSRCNSFDIDKYYLSRCLCRYQNIYNVYMCVQIRIFMPKSEIRIKFGIYNSDILLRLSYEDIQPNGTI